MVCSEAEGNDFADIAFPVFPEFTCNGSLGVEYMGFNRVWTPDCLCRRFPIRTAFPFPRWHEICHYRRCMCVPRGWCILLLTSALATKSFADQTVYTDALQNGWASY